MAGELFCLSHVKASFGLHPSMAGLISKKARVCLQFSTWRIARKFSYLRG
jgi:hypothetical protein